MYIDLKATFSTGKALRRRNARRLREVSSFGDSGEIHAREDGLPRGDWPGSPKLETTRSLA